MKRSNCGNSWKRVALTLSWAHFRWSISVNIYDAIKEALTQTIMHGDQIRFTFSLFIAQLEKEYYDVILFII